jgi:hypothetical protein
LENHHISETFKTLLKPECDITSNLKIEEYNHFRRRVIDCILATDMAKHVKHIGVLRNKMETYKIKNGENVDKLINNENSAKNYKSKQIILSFTIHSSDISSPAKSSKIYDEWIDLVFIEFFYQGDIEKKKNLPVTILCDRTTTDIVNSQIGFINFCVKPTFECLINLFPNIEEYYLNIKKNLRRYEVKFEIQKKELKKLKKIEENDNKKKKDF